MKSPTKQPSIYDSICILCKLYMLDGAGHIIIQIYQTQKVPQITESPRGQKKISFGEGDWLLDVLGFFFFVPNVFSSLSSHGVFIKFPNGSSCFQCVHQGVVPNSTTLLSHLFYPYPGWFNWKKLSFERATSTIDSHGRVENPQYFPSSCSYDFNKKWFETPQFTYFYMGQ